MRRRSSHNESSSVAGGPPTSVLSSVQSTQSLKPSEVNRVRPTSAFAKNSTLPSQLSAPLQRMHDNQLTSAAPTSTIGREARELASRMHVDLAHIKGSVDLQTQTDRALVLCADRHFHATAKMWLSAATSSAPHEAVPTATPSFHFVPISTAPLLSLKLQEGRTLSFLNSSRTQLSTHGSSRHHARHRRSTSVDGGGLVQLEDMSTYHQSYYPADHWGASEDDEPGQVIRGNVINKSQGQKIVVHPRWNVSSKPNPETVADPAPLSVEEPAVSWIARKKAAKRSSSADSAKGASGGGGGLASGTSNQRRLRFEDPDGIIRLGGGHGRPPSSNAPQQRPGGATTTGQGPVRSGIADESLERVFAPTTFGQSSTGLWSQVSEEKVRALYPSHAQPPRAVSHSRDAASASESKAFFRGIGDVGSKALGLHIYKAAGPHGGDNNGSAAAATKDELYVRKQLHAMNINLSGSSSGGAVMDHPLWGGVVLCRLVNVIVRQFLPRQQLKEIPIRNQSGMVFSDVKENYVNALTRIREFQTPNGLDPIPPGLLYLDPKEVLAGEAHDTLWALLAKLLETFVLKTTDRLPSPHSTSSTHGASNAIVQVPVLGRYCEVYAARNMSRLEESVCQFLFGLGVLVEPTKHSIPADDDLSAALLPGPLAAPFLPEKRSRWHLRRTPFTSISLSSVFPYLSNGSALLDVVCHVLDVDIPVHRNPRVRNLCLANIRRAQDELQKHYPSRISNLFLCDPVPVFEGDKAFILLLMEDIMRFASKAPPRKSLPAIDQSPFLLPEKWTAGVATTSSQSGAAATGDVPPLSAGMANASYASQFVQPERQAFVSQATNAATAAPHHWTLAELAGQRDDSMDDASFTPPPRQRDIPSTLQPEPHPFTISKSNPPPKHIKLRAMGVTTTAPSSGRSIVPSDESPEELYDDAPEPPALLPRHLEYLTTMKVEERELAFISEWLAQKLGRAYLFFFESPEELYDDAPEPPALLPRHLEYLTTMKVEERELAFISEWLAQKLGRAYRYQAADASFDVNAKDLRLSHPCLIFSDGVVFCHLVRILSYHKCPQLDNVQKAPKTTAAKRNNIKKVLEYLRLERKTLVDYVFLEDVLVTGDLRAVVLVIRALRASYKNHISSHK
ncbi:Hypothetical protein, putative [Bodo saltans]|uniref:Calponin-homology (CH) domain-containing protein n=1 Tax=Bodo saltans TaxID=75058 RepID=A0A0S4JIH2_BODSA|nr:Hypothetical protein, putative [Bodo saltans]|eukprot:CUG91255.1 Hypothetical protein, putative [Bodo saltans]